jgi:hypothetical protein
MVEVEVVADVREELEMSLYSRLDVNLEKILLVETKNYIEIEEKFFFFCFLVIFTYAVVDAGDEPCRIAAAIAAVVFDVVRIP